MSSFFLARERKKTIVSSADQGDGSIRWPSTEAVEPAVDFNYMIRIEPSPAQCIHIEVYINFSIYMEATDFQPCDVCYLIKHGLFWVYCCTVLLFVKLNIYSKLLSLVHLTGMFFRTIRLRELFVWRGFFSFCGEFLLIISNEMVLEDHIKQLNYVMVLI